MQAAGSGAYTSRRGSVQFAELAPGEGGVDEIQSDGELAATQLAEEASTQETLSEQRRLYLLARVIVARHYRRPLNLNVVATSLATSPRKLQRAYKKFGECTFQEDLTARRMTAAADLLAKQPAMAVSEVAGEVGYRGRLAQFARAFTSRYGQSPRRFREQALSAVAA